MWDIPSVRTALCAPVDCFLYLLFLQTGYLVVYLRQILRSVFCSHALGTWVAKVYLCGLRLVRLLASHQAQRERVSHGFRNTTERTRSMRASCPEHQFCPPAQCLDTYFPVCWCKEYILSTLHVINIQRSDDRTWAKARYSMYFFERASNWHKCRQPSVSTMISFHIQCVCQCLGILYCATHCAPSPDITQRESPWQRERPRSQSNSTQWAQREIGGWL